MRPTVAISALVLTIGSAVMAYAVATSGTSSKPAAQAPPTGVELLRSFRCKQAETKRIIIRGVEDGFSPAGEENGFIRAGRRDPRTTSHFVDSVYDQYAPDRPFTDSFEVPSRIASGLFVISLRKVSGNDNDLLMLGDAPGSDGRSRFSTLMPELDRLPGWQRFGAVHAAPLDRIRMHLYRAALQDDGTLLDHVRAGRSTTWVDVVVQDDTSVDFMGMAVCEQPPKGKGLSLAPFHHLQDRPPGILALGCRSVHSKDHVCNPYRGDTACSTRLPVACFKPGDAPVPKAMIGVPGSGSWSGGSLALTEPAAASRFATVRDVDRLCSSRFGADWRVASVHDGINEGLLGYGDQSTVRSRVWVDIAGQPYATCWSR